MERDSMPKQEKLDKVKGLAERFRSAQGLMFANFQGLTVKDATELRRSLGSSEVTLAVVKNTLTRIAAKDADLQSVLPLLEGPTAVAFVKGDPVTGAKALLELTRRFPALDVKGAVIEGRVFGAEDAKSLANIEAKEVSLGKMAGLLQAPLARTSYLLQAPLQRIAFALAERGRQTEAA
jgi:large subunit ribosomal protein L10